MNKTDCKILSDGIPEVNTSSIMYNLRIGKELAKQVYKAEKLAPPKSVAEVVTAWATIVGRASNPDWYFKTIKSGEWVSVALAGVQAWIFWSLGQAIGRRNRKSSPDFPSFDYC